MTKEEMIKDIHKKIVDIKLSFNFLLFTYVVLVIIGSILYGITK